MTLKVWPVSLDGSLLRDAKTCLVSLDIVYCMTLKGLIRSQPHGFAVKKKKHYVQRSGTSTFNQRHKRSRDLYVTVREKLI